MTKNKSNGKLVVKNFGPINYIELEVKPFMVFIGPQASGKSTISKSVYFFKSLRDDVFKYFLEVLESGKSPKPLGTVAKRIRKKFLNFFGPTAHLDDLYLHYEFGNNKNLEITLNRQYVNPEFSKEFKSEFFEILEQIKTGLSKPFLKDPKFLSSSEILQLAIEKRNAVNQIKSLVNQLFEDDKDLLFIPAGRSLITTLSDQLQYIHPHKTDYLMQAFIERINTIKPLFSKSLQELVNDKLHLTDETLKFGYINSAKKIIENILKAKYISEFDGEKLYVSNDKYVKINYSSSGQQEAVWILNLIFISLLNNHKLFIVIEEPEAHLYPEAQKEIIDLVALLFNATRSQVIITTHSPYILSSINNLVYADVLMKKGKNISSVIEKRKVIDHHSIHAFFVQNGKIEDIIDNDTHLIKIEAIDSASKVLNDTFNKLFEMDDYEM